MRKLSKRYGHVSITKPSVEKKQPLFAEHEHPIILPLLLLIIIPPIFISSHGYQYCVSFLHTFSLDNPNDTRSPILTTKLVHNLGITQLTFFMIISFLTDYVFQTRFVFQLFYSKIEEAARTLFYQISIYMGFSIIYIFSEFITDTSDAYNYTILLFIVKNVINLSFFIHIYLNIKDRPLLPP